MARAARGVVAASAEVEEQEQDRLGLITASTRHVALLAAVLATGGSLFFSEVWGWTPCELCWYQRILMYPLTVILAVGILRDDRGVHLYALPFSLTGMAVSLFHYLEVLKIIEPSPCSGGVPCSIDYLNFVGPLAFVKIPFLALVAFFIISVMLGNYALAGAPNTPKRALPGSRIAVGAIVALVGLALIGLGISTAA